MIVDGILFIVNSVVQTLLLPLDVIDIVIDVVSSVSILTKFVSLVAYILPWGNILPIFIFIVSMFLFRGIIALIKTIWDLLPLL